MKILQKSIDKPPIGWYNIITARGNTPKERKIKMFEAQLMNSLKSDFGITTNKYNKTIKLLVRQYVTGKISKVGMIDILKGFSKEA